MLNSIAFGAGAIGLVEGLSLMKKRHALTMLCALLFAAALFALPNVAHAGEIHLNQDSFKKEDGSYTFADLTNGNTYILDEDAYGYVLASLCVSVLDLNGHTLTCPSECDEQLLDVGALSQLTVKNGNLVQDNPNKPLATLGYRDCTLTLDLGEGHSATSVNGSCAEVSDCSTLTLVSGTCENKNKLGSNNSVFKIGGTTLDYTEGGSVVVKGGSVRLNDGSSIATMETNGTFVLEGGSYNAYPSQATAVAEGKMLRADSYPDGLFYVDDAESTKSDYNNYVSTGSALGDVAFKLRSEAVSFAESLGLAESSVGSYIYGVHFDGNGGTPASYVTSVHYGQKVTAPVVTKEGCGLLGWTDSDTGADFDLNTAIDHSVSLKAKWFDVVARVGDVDYQSLQDAINDAEDGDTVTLCADTTESIVIPTGGKLTIDLGGKTLTSKSTPTSDAIRLTGARDVTIENGVIINTYSMGRCIYADAEVSLGSTLTLASTLTCESNSSYDAIWVEGKMSSGVQKNTSLVIQGGSYSNTGSSTALRVEAAELSVAAGTFATYSDKSILIRDTATASLLCDASGYIGLENGASKNSVTIQPGSTFGRDKNKNDIDTDAYHLLKNEAGKYEVAEHVKEWVIDREPTSTTAGSKHQKCTVDGCTWESDPVEIPAGSETDAPVIEGISDGLSYDCDKTFTVTDASAFTVTAGGKEISKNLDGSFTLPLGEGLTIVAKDKWGNESSVTNVSNYEDHAWGTPKDTGDGTYHTLTCSHSGCLATNKVKHSGGKATCKTPATCEACGARYGGVDPNNHEGFVSSTLSYDESGHWRTYTCCPDVVYPGSKSSHQLKTEIVKEPTATEAGHEHDVCEYCGYTTNERDISPTGGAPAIVGLVDGGSYDLEGGAPTFTVSCSADITSVTVNGNPASTSAGGYVLDTTGECKIVATDVYGRTATVAVTCSATHDWGAWQGRGDGTHVRYCSHDGCTEPDVANCSGGQATCTSKAVCSVCGSSYGEKDAGNHSGPLTWRHSDGEHWQTCDGCGQEVAGTRSTHSLERASDTNGHWEECACGYTTAHEEHALAWQHDDEGNHWQQCSDCGYTTAKASHEFGAWQAVDDASHKRACADCGYAEEEGHTYVWVDDKEATATEDGHRHQECSTCGYENGVEEVVPKTGGDSSDDDDDKGGDSDKKDDGSDDKGDADGSDGEADKKADSKKLPSTGDSALAISAISAAGAALAALGLKRRK